MARRVRHWSPRNQRPSGQHRSPRPAPACPPPSVQSIPVYGTGRKEIVATLAAPTSEQLWQARINADDAADHTPHLLSEHCASCGKDGVVLELTIPAGEELTYFQYRCLLCGDTWQDPID